MVKEQEFTHSTSNDRFVIVGAAYQPGGQGAYGAVNTQDPLSNATICLRDAALMQKLGVNTIRSYNVDPTLNHDECASIFNAVGIYMILDVNSPLSGQSLDRTNPSGSYTTSYLQHIFSVVEAFKSYPNTLAFFAGNEIINDISFAQSCPPYIRAVQRDLKNYIAAHADRPIPVGYSAADVRELLADTSAYLQCDNSGGSGNDTSRSDFIGLNSYSWCGSDSSFTTSGYDQLVSIFSNSTIPVFFSEYGCNKPTPRVFDEVPTIFGPQMLDVLSGGLVYEWTQETDDYGLISYSANGSASLLPDYVALAGQYAKINASLLEATNSTATSLTPPACSPGLITESGFSTDFDIPAPPPGAEALISSGVSGAQSGSLVTVTQTSVQVAVYSDNGALISPLAITKVSGANDPGSGTLAASPVSASATGTATTATAAGAASASPSKGAGNAVYRLDVGVMGSAAAAAVFAIGAFAL